MEENTDQGSTGSRNKSLKDTLKSGSADEVKERVKETVEKGVAAVAGALKGFNEKTESSDLPGETKRAVHQAAETAKSAVSSVSEEARGLKEPLREAGQELSKTARDLRSGVHEQVDETKSAIRGSSSSMGMGGSELGTPGRSAGSTTSRPGGQGRELPDISRTPLAESDRKLAGKDLTEETE